MLVGRRCGTPARRLALAAILLTIASSPLVGQGRGEQIDRQLAARVDSLFAPWDKTDSPGCAVAVFRNSEIIHARGYGMASLEHGLAITPKTVFDIGSTSKQFAAMSIVLLAEDGALSLDDDVRRFVPELPDYGNRITIRHLLTHTSGLRDYLTLWSLAGFEAADYTTSAEALSLIARQRSLNFRPGEQYLYSNSGYFLLSVIVERVSGKSLAAYSHERIFAPLGMAHTRFNDDHSAIIANRATGYMPRTEGGYAVSMSNYEQTGDGAVNTSVEDLLRWDENFYTGRVGGRRTLELMQTPAVLKDGRQLTYALGLRVEPYRGLPTVSHGGSWVGYRAELVRFPDQHFSVACLCNRSDANPSRLARRVADIYLADEFTRQEGESGTEPVGSTNTAVSVDASVLERYVGLYRDPRTGAVIRFAVRGDTLYDAAPDRSARAPLTPIAADRFRRQGGADVLFQGGDSRQARQVRIGMGADAITAERIPEANPSATELARYVGTYDSDEIGATYTIAVEGGMLMLHRRRADPIKLVPTYADAFAADGLLFAFERRGGRIVGMTVDAGRTRGLSFTRRAR
jgi:CubicO group peptidase (beta-lactamase class C family)